MFTLAHNCTKSKLGMRIPLLGFLIIVLNICVLPISAQGDPPPSDPKKKLPKEVEKANAAYEAQQYTDAIELLKDALSEVRGREDKSDIMFRLAECYRMTLDYRNAETYYEKAIKVGYKDPVAKLHQADMLKAQGEYEEAIVVYQEYKKENPTDPRGEIGVESTKKAKEWMEQPSRYQVDNMKDINSNTYDYAPAFTGKRKNENILVFTSDREESVGKKQDGWTGGDFHDLYITEAERKTVRRRGAPVETDVESPANMKWSTPVLLDEAVVNTEGNEGFGIFDSRDKEFYFTRCLTTKNQTLECGIYVTEKLGTNWKAPERLIIGTDTLANVGQPNLSPDDKTLYFVSDDFGGKGHDIFMTTYDRRSKTWTNPKNLGPKVNTVGREYSPFVHDDGYMYFSSNGHGGMGGLDVFRIKMGEDGMPAKDAVAENMQFPINTSADDWGLIFKPGGDEVGFMTSNRKGSKGDDIYAVVKTPLVINIEGVVTSSKTGQSIDQVTVKLEGSDGSSYVVNTDKDGYYLFDRSKTAVDVTYKITFEKQKFLTNAGDVTTVGIDLSSYEYIPSENVFLNIQRLNKSLDPIEEPIVLPNVFFALSSAVINEASGVALDSVVTILNNNPTIVIELRSHTDYRGTNAANDDLSQRRADSSVAYLRKKGIPAARMVARGMGENEPYVIPENYRFYGKGQFEPGTKLTEKYILTLPPEKQEVANQINRRTDLKVLRDDYVPASGPLDKDAVDPKAIIEDKRDGVNNDPPGEIYIMKDRESLGSVARDQRISIIDIKKLNGGLRGVRPFEGLQLKVTKDGNYEQWDATHYQVTRRGTSIKDIAKELGLDDDKLEEMNPDVDHKELPVGYWVKTK